MKVLIVEERSSGHLLVYVRLLAEHALSQGASVTVALTREVLHSREFLTHLEPISKTLAIIDLQAPLTVASLRELVSNVKPDVTIVPHGDELAVRIGKSPLSLGDAKVRLLIMRDPRWERPASLLRRLRGAVKLALIVRAGRARGVKIVWLREPGHVGTRGEIFARDPFIADSSIVKIDADASLLRKEMVMGDEIFWIGVTGAITPWKNIPVVIEALKILRKQRPEATFGFAVIGPIRDSSGVTDASIREECARIGVPVVVDDRLLTNHQMNAAVVAFDAVVMAYSTHSPNSTMGKAYVLGTRLVAAGPPSIRSFVRNLGSGWETPLNAFDIAGSIGEAIDSVRPSRHLGELSAAEFASDVVGPIVQRFHDQKSRT